MNSKKTIYIAGPMTGVDKYWEAFERAEEDLIAIGHIPLSPAKNPQGLTNAQYMHMCLGMINAADAVVFLNNWERSYGATLEAMYCKYTQKPFVFQRTRDTELGKEYPLEVTRLLLKHDLEEVFKT